MLNRKKNILICFFVFSFFMLSTAPMTAAAPSVDIDTMIGQMIMVGFRGMTVDNSSTIVKEIKEQKIGGVVLFSKDCLLDFGPRNIKNPEQVKKLVLKLQKSSGIPLLVAVDQEGGRVQRLKSEQGFEETESAASLGRSGLVRKAFEAGEKVGDTLSSVGFNLDFAPVLDLNVNPENPVIGSLNRSFSSDPLIVSKFGEAFIRGLRSQGVLSCVKHFPGHGSSTGDSHLGLTDVTDTWTEKELEPFEYMIKDHRTDMIMTAHIFNKHLDTHYPATLSNKVIKKLLREKLGYNGVVITDDMQMKAVSDSYGLKDSVYLAIQSGADILLFANNISYDEQIGSKVFEVIKQLLKEGRISPQRIERSFDRIMKLKKKIIL